MMQPKKKLKKDDQRAEMILGYYGSVIMPKGEGK